MPAGVSAAAVSGTLGLSLLQKVLRIVGKRKSFAGDRGELAALLEAAGVESQRLARCADEDIAAYRGYMAARKLNPEGAGAGAAAVVETPLRAARSALKGLDLCAAAAEMVDGAVAADLVTAAILLSGSVRAMAQSAGMNLRESADQTARLSCEEIEAAALRQLDLVVRRLA